MSGGTPTNFSTPGGARTSPGRGVAASRMTQIEWHEARLAAPVEITGTTEKTPTPEEQLREQLGLREGDQRPILLYFHYAHAGDEGESESGAKVTETRAGKESRKQCGKFDDESVARWSRLYRFVEVDASGSDPAIVRQFGGQADKPSFAVLDTELKLVKTSPLIGSSRKFLAFLQRTIETSFEEHWTAVQETIEKQEKAIDEAEELADDDEYAAATKLLFEVVVSDVRIGKRWDDAVGRYWVMKAKADGG